MSQKLIEYYSVCIPQLFYQHSGFQTTSKFAIIKFSIDFPLHNMPYYDIEVLPLLYHSEILPAGFFCSWQEANISLLPSQYLIHVVLPLFIQSVNYWYTKSKKLQGPIHVIQTLTKKQLTCHMDQVCIIKPDNRW